MNRLPTLPNELVLDFLVGKQTYWKTVFNNVLKEVSRFQADTIVSILFDDAHFNRKQLDFNILILKKMFLIMYKFKNRLINNILHVLKCNGSSFYYYIKCEFAIDNYT